MCIVSLATVPICNAQQQTPINEASRPRLSFSNYITEVLHANLDLSAQRANISIAKAQVTTASARPDWSASLGLPSVDLSSQGAPTTTTTGLTVPVELGGKRNARIKAASADLSTITSDYEDAVRQLQANGADAFIDALGARAVLQSKNKSLSQLDRIVEVNQERLRVGDIGEIELIQSRVERDQFKADVISADADVFSADVDMAQLLGTSQKLGEQQLPVPTGSLEIATRTFQIEQLIANSLQKRPDVISRVRAVQAADQRIRLARVNLFPDLQLNAGYAHTGTGTGGFAQPPDNTIAGGISINLPISRRRNPGDLEAARATYSQAELQLRSVERKAEAEIRDAYRRYQASASRLNVFRGGLLKDADKVLEARLYAYQRGGATLLEVLDAERKSAELYLAYSQALADHAHALVKLETSAVIWDVSF